MRRNSTKRIMNMVELSLLVALVVVLQVLSAVLPKIGTVSITLTLVPLVVGAILHGKKGGSILGFFFGLIVLINCIVALDIGGNILWAANPFLTALLCFVKGIAAGFCSALVYKLLIGKNEEKTTGRIYLSTLVAAMIAPIVNTGIFLVGMFVFFKDVLYSWAGGSDIITYVIVGLVGINFIVEFVINVVLTPAIVTIINAVKKNRR